MAGHRGDEATAWALTGSTDPAVRATALGALARMGALTVEAVTAALVDPSAVARRRAVALAVHPPADALDLSAVLADDDPTVAETAAWALGERAQAGAPVVEALAAAATGHGDALVREAAVAALGAIGDESGLPAILQATTDKPAIRRRAVIALAPFEGPRVDAALQRARKDRDWQTRQAAEDLTTDP